MAVAIKGSATASTTTVTLPAHVAGDVILMYAFRRAADTTSALTPPTVPAAGGTVPAWTTLFSSTGNTDSTSSCSDSVAWTVATSNNHTSGTWTNATRVVAVVLSGASSSPIGGSADIGDRGVSGDYYAPAITMSRTNGTSAVLHFFGSSNQSTQWSSTAPAGYTLQFPPATGVTVAFLTKNVTTSDGALWYGNDLYAAVAYRGTTVEIVAAGGSAFTGSSSTSVQAGLSTGGKLNAAAAAPMSVSATLSADARTASQYSAAAQRSVVATLTADAVVAPRYYVDSQRGVSASLSGSLAQGSAAGSQFAVSATLSAAAVKSVSVEADLAVNVVEIAKVTFPPRELIAVPPDVRLVDVAAVSRLAGVGFVSRECSVGSDVRFVEVPALNTLVSV